MIPITIRVEPEHKKSKSRGKRAHQKRQHACVMHYLREGIVAVDEVVDARVRAVHELVRNGLETAADEPRPEMNARMETKCQRKTGHSCAVLMNSCAKDRDVGPAPRALAAERARMH